MAWYSYIIIAGALLLASWLISKIFQQPRPTLPETRQMVSVTSPEYYSGLREQFYLHYNWTIPSQECLSQYTPAYRDPAVKSLHPGVARDILAVLEETEKQKEEN